jgi:hypothetical protein
LEEGLWMNGGVKGKKEKRRAKKGKQDRNPGSSGRYVNSLWCCDE